MPGTPTPNAPPKKGSVRDSMFKKLREKATTGPPMDDAEPTPTPEPRAPSTPSNQPEPEPEPATEPTPAEPTAATDPKAAADPKKGKVNPWKLVDEYKGKIAKLESEVAEAGKRGIPKPEWEAVQSKLTKVEARAKELEEEIKYVNYTKSEEYKVKYEEPYVKAWGRAMGELKELTVEDGQGNQRPVSQDDLLELVNLPLVKAKQMATEKFGEFADEVMSHRKEIRKLHDESAAALEQARKAAGERETATGAQQKEMQSSVLQEWNRSNEEIVSNEKYGTYFKPVEGDEQGNQRLAKGFELADRAFSESPLDPRLTPEQRKSIVQRHAVVRNRAAAFGRLVHQIGQKEARIAELEKELSGYRGSEPDAEGRRPAPTSQAAGGTKMDGVLADLRRRAK
jgi:cell division protein FtsB